jgi:hypothetical protein
MKNISKSSVGEVWVVILINKANVGKEKRQKGKFEKKSRPQKRTMKGKKTAATCRVEKAKKHFLPLRFFLLYIGSIFLLLYRVMLMESFYFASSFDVQTSMSWRRL